MHAPRPAQEFIRFLKRLDTETPVNLELHLIVDNCSEHKHPRVNFWLARHPRFNLHFTRTSSSWLNLLARWFRELTQQHIQPGSFHAAGELVTAITQYIDNHNQKPQVFAWTASVNNIMGEISSVKKRWTHHSEGYVFSPHFTASIWKAAEEVHRRMLGALAQEEVDKLLETQESENPIRFRLWQMQRLACDYGGVVRRTAKSFAAELAQGVGSRRGRARKELDWIGEAVHDAIVRMTSIEVARNFLVRGICSLFTLENEQESAEAFCSVCCRVRQKWPAF